ncbi:MULTISPECIES: hypothetical protein [unclassified Paraburkholderia]|uniref:hypothetical protein n=1 Tax=unclassified Paraburkholderia TaxID=2615204 RepID=UPI002AAF6EBF|nr:MULTISPECIES: hypothetical protein [unclassified Paraburkholderia]
MARFRKKPVVIEAITFEELVAAGIATGAPLTNGFPWSFEYAGHAITHENDDCYLVPTLEGSMRFERGDMLITGVMGEIYPCKADIFAATYEPEAVVRRTVVEFEIPESRKFRVMSLGVPEDVVADSWDTASGTLILKRAGQVVASFRDWSGFTTE